MFVIVLSYKTTLEEVDKYLPGHMLYLKKNQQNGHFICSGPRNPRTGGVILCRAENEETVRNIVREDPFITNGVADYELINFRSVECAEGFETLLDKVV
jgi:uncharacterized protein YciI